jgi:hypothetical protein
MSTQYGLRRVSGPPNVIKHINIPLDTRNACPEGPSQKIFFSTSSAHGVQPTFLTMPGDMGGKKNFCRGTPDACARVVRDTGSSLSRIASRGVAYFTR